MPRSYVEQIARDLNFAEIDLTRPELAQDLRGLQAARARAYYEQLTDERLAEIAAANPWILSIRKADLAGHLTVLVHLETTFGPVSSYASGDASSEYEMLFSVRQSRNLYQRTDASHVEAAVARAIELGVPAVRYFTCCGMPFLRLYHGTENSGDIAVTTDAVAVIEKKAARLFAHVASVERYRTKPVSRRIAKKRAKLAQLLAA